MQIAPDTLPSELPALSERSEFTLSEAEESNGSNLSEWSEPPATVATM